MLDISIVKAWREHLGLTQQEVSDRAGLLQPAFLRIEAGSKPHKATRDQSGRSHRHHI
jgi:transcriptional regulator with XRE-family HTH domain